MGQAVRKTRWLVLLAAGLLCGCGGSADDGRPALGVTTSYIECAVRDLAGETIRTVRLLPPGTCPGHFDVTPGMVRDLRRCAALLRFDFQAGLDERLSRLTASGMRIIAVPAGEGLCVPETYAATCRAVCAALAECVPTCADAFGERLKQVEARMARLDGELRAKVATAGLEGAPVVTSGHQAAFCEALGLRVIATYTGGDEQSLARLAALIEQGEQAGVRFVIANEQEGPQLADPLAQRLGARPVVFSNFPSMSGEQDTFDELVEANLRALTGEAKP